MPSLHSNSLPPSSPQLSDHPELPSIRKRTGPSATINSSPPKPTTSSKFLSASNSTGPRLRSRSLSPSPRFSGPIRTTKREIKRTPYCRARQAYASEHAHAVQSIESGAYALKTTDEIKAGKTKFLDGIRGFSDDALRRAAAVKHASCEVLRHEMLLNTWKIEEAARKVAFYEEIQNDARSTITDVVEEYFLIKKQLDGEATFHAEEYRDFEAKIIRGDSMVAAADEELNQLHSAITFRHTPPSSDDDLSNTYTPDDDDSGPDIAHVSSDYDSDCFDELGEDGTRIDITLCEGPGAGSLASV
ncbi:hypothetical protein BV22DRAFT_1052374 [Leucogyrophana mollusca]|uniref:Uncharacterized protein n=1 Tax=Leucogyrophana mollusca TaxID=85980 RepID=A0ACB8AWB4_9AGAM|nr:hypothetical protein BV22DRAFT_1052374 [Leucogyrophana mollusca]